MLFEKRRVNTSKRPDGVRVLAPYKDCGDNTWKDHVPAGTCKNLQRPALTRVNQEGQEGPGPPHEPVRAMTVDYGVMPIEAVWTLLVMTKEVTPLTGKGALGKWRTQNISPAGHRARITGQKAIRCLTVVITMQFRGVCRQVLKFRAAWEDSTTKCCCCQPYSVQRKTDRTG